VHEVHVPGQARLRPHHPRARLASKTASPSVACAYGPVLALAEQQTGSHV
jgi:hypothetical protein